MKLRNLKIIALALDGSLGSQNSDMTALLCFGSNLEEVIGSIKKKADEITLFAPSVPVYGDNIFNASFYEKNKEKIEKARLLFVDEKSKEVFDSIIDYRLSGDIKYLFDCQTDRETNYEFLNLENEVFVDLGAYRGDTLVEVNGLCNIQKAFACEPDRKSFEKLKKNTAYIKNVSYFNCAVGEKSGETLFKKSRGRGSSLADTGERIPLKSVDYLLSGERATYIKYDVEGNEKSALLGSVNTIKKYTPKLKIAAYHRSEDIFLLPLLINEICDRYSLFLRHEPSLPDWDTDIFAIAKE